MNNPDENDIGARLRIAREARGLSRRALAKRADVGNGTISLIESGADFVVPISPRDVSISEGRRFTRRQTSTH